MPAKHHNGFTLLELSIVLTVIGLLAGGVLVGEDMIRAASVKSTVSQVQRYKTVVGTFQAKFAALPGDISPLLVKRYGFTARDGTAGRGDGNNLLDGQAGKGSLLQGGGETGLFWVDLSSANGLNLNLIENSFNSASNASLPTTSATTLPSYLPAASIGRGNYFYVYESNGTNYFGLSAVLKLSVGVLDSVPSLSVMQAYQIDQKIDDGFPLLGSVIATYLDKTGIYWSAGNGGYDSGQVGIGNTSATPPSASTCYDNGNVNGNAQNYSITTKRGSGANCALSFEF